MIAIADRQPSCVVDEAEYRRLLGYPREHQPGERSRELAEAARAWYAARGRPWIFVREVACELSATALRLDGAEFNSPALHGHFTRNQVQRALLVAVSAGGECEQEAQRLWREGKPDEYFFLEVFGSAVVEQLVASANGRLCAQAEQAGLIAIPHYSPGYTGWDVAEQNLLFDLIKRQHTVLPGPLEVLPSGMLRPKKSLLAVVGLSAQDSPARASDARVPCATCSLASCQFRRGPYRHAPGRSTSRPPQPAPLSPQARYSVNPRALSKWATERVRLERRDDGSIAARFRFDGTTCSNLGHPLAFDYSVVLSARQDNYRLLETDCRPSPGDTGYENMCAYLSDRDELMQAISSERPLLGRPIDDVLRWERASAPSGCHCTAESRTHKWGLALEAIHYALAQAEKSAASAEVPSLNTLSP